MPYTMADFRRDNAREQFEKLSPEERRELLAGLPTEELRAILASLPPEELRAILVSLLSEKIEREPEQLKAKRPAGRKSRKGKK